MRVCPSNKLILEGLPEREKPSTQSWFRAFMFLTTTYNTTSWLFFEGEEITIFGLLKYNTRSEEFTIDNPIAFFLGDAKFDLISQLKVKRAKKLLQTAALCVLCGIFGTLTLKAGRATYLKYKQYKLHQAEMELKEQDQLNKIPGAPPQTRSLNGLAQDQTVWVDGYACKKCKKAPRTVVF